jgi:hypothetical protein
MRCAGRGAILATLGAASAAGLLACCGPFDVDAAISDIQERYGVAVEYTIGPDFFPAEWTAPHTSAVAEPISDPELRRLLRLLPDWLDKYPATALRADLRGIRLCGSLLLNDVGAAGTATESNVYLASEGRREGYSDRFLELTFHHELSSLFLYNRIFPIHDWVEANPAGFEYMTDPAQVLEAVEGRRQLDGGPADYRVGLLAPYGRTNLENDLNIYAEFIFGEPERMKRLIQEYPVIAAKYEVFKSFYLSISPEFEAWFARIG